MRRVVLVRPSGPRNVGMIVRVAANFGPCEIALVAPERPSLLVHPDFEQMSHGVANVSKRCRIFATLPDALSECTSSIGFTARVHGRRTRIDWRAIQGEISARSNDAEQRVALVFGNETTGLTAAESTLLGDLVHIATSDEHTSLNLAIAVGVVLSDLFTERGSRKTERGAKALSGEGREYLKANLRHILADKIARTPSARRDIIASIERVFSRSPLEDRDARAWHLVLRALGSELTPKDLGLDLGEKRARRKAAVRAAQAKEERGGKARR